MKKTVTVYSAALDYFIKKGYSVFPAGKNKRPAIKDWKLYQTEYPSEDDLAKWFKGTDNNIIITTGKISGITVVDIDNPKISINQFPETYTVRSGNGGYHLYYQYYPGSRNSASAYPKYPGLDIRSEGGYVIAPPSVTDYLDKDGQKKGGEYTVVKNIAIAPYPIDLLPINVKKKTALSEKIGVTSGSRNDKITSFIGTLLQASKEDLWISDCWPAVERVNKTYNPPLPDKELRTTFESIVKTEQARRQSLVLSPIQVDGEQFDIPIKRSKTGTAYRDMANVFAILAHHPFYKGTLRYNEFTQEIEFNKKSITDSDITKIQHFMQEEMELRGITKEAVYSAISHYASQNSYDEAQDWLKSQIWDGTPRLASWISEATGLPNDPYYQGVGAHWLTGLVRRIMKPGCIFDNMLLLVGPQGIGKTSFFRIIGGPWYKSYTGAIDNKDFYLTLRGALLIDLDEGAAMYKTEAIKIKSVITETHDEYRAPYDRVTKKYPRRFGFSMSTNNTEPFRDVTGNRRYWVVDCEEKINFGWLEENRDQLFAEAHYYWQNNIAIPEVPLIEAQQRQEDHLSDDPWSDTIVEEVRKYYDYCIGKEDFSITIKDVFLKIAKDDISKLDRRQEMRIAEVFKRSLGLEKRQTMVNGIRASRWFIMKKKLLELQANNVEQIKTDFGDF
jgi:hypothetical protein